MIDLFRGQLGQLIATHFKETAREPYVLFWGILFPILMSLGLGIAFTRKADVVRNVAVVRSQETPDLSEGDDSEVERFLLEHAERIKVPNKEPRYKITMKNEKLGNTILFLQETDWQNAMRLLKRGHWNVVVEDRQGILRYHFDPLNPDAQLTYRKLKELMGGEAFRILQDSSDIQPLTVAGSRYIDFLVPGLISMGIMMSCLWGVSYSIIEKRSQKLLRRMVATPMKKSYFLISLMSVRLAMNLIESGLLFLFACIVFHVSVQGEPAALIAAFLAGNIAFMGIAVFLSCHTAKTEIGNGLINAVVFPMMVLSGIFFSYHNFPEWSIPFIEKLPLTLLADTMRSVFIEGAGISEIGLSAGILTAVGVFFFAAGLRLFKWH